jgi:hypothetical protein
MALGDSYASVEELKNRLGITDNNDDGRVGDALSSVSREIEGTCGRQFNKTTSASARIFYPHDACWATVDDFHTTTGLVIAVDQGDDGTYETAWVAADYQLEPLNGVVDGEQGWPYFKIRAMSSQVLPTGVRRAPLQVIAQWGWAAVPAPVKEACLILAAETFKLKDAPFGVAGFGEFGALRVRDNPMAAKKLAPYMRLGGFA